MQAVRSGCVRHAAGARVALCRKRRLCLPRKLYPGCAEWEKDIGKNKIRTRLFIPQGLDARVLLIDGADRLPLIWDTDLSPRRAGKRSLPSH